MQRRGFLAFLVLAFAALVACSPGEGPLVINASGRTIELVVHSGDGSVFRGTCEHDDALWIGKSHAATTRVEIQIGSEHHVIEGEALKVRYGKDRATAFIVEATGPRKLTLDEARIFLRDRP